MEAWLVTIAHRKAIDVVRGPQPAPVPVEDCREAAEPGLGVPGADDSELGRRSRALPDKQRQAVAYHYWPACPTPRSPRSSAAPPTRRAGPRQTASRNCEELPGRSPRTNGGMTIIPTPRCRDPRGSRRLGRPPSRRTARRRLPVVDSPVGPLLLAATPQGWCGSPTPARATTASWPPWPAAEPARAAGAEAARRGGAGTRRVLRRAAPRLRPAARPVAVQRLPAAGPAAPARDRLRADPQLRAGGRSWSAARRRSARSAPPAPPTRCPWSYPATGCCAPTVRPAATSAAPPPRRRC